MEVVIREAVEKDLPMLLSIYNAAIKETTATFDLDEQTLEERLVWFHKYGGRYPLIVAEFEGIVAGYCHLSPFREKQAYARTVEISVYIDNQFKGQGIGKKLMEHIIDLGRTIGHHAIIAGITTGNDVSVHLHKKLGFEYVGTFKEVGYKFDEWQSVDFYELLLD